MKRIIVSLAGLAFLAKCAQAYSQVGLSGFDAVLAQPWGMVTLWDVFLGALCVSAIIFTQEKNWRIALLWSLPIFALGHVVSAAWVVFRFLPQREPTKTK
ncbi:MAG: DUF1475 family protein [Alphaproteobacteria bacterium]|nr:DUF1475 family protein [Alphaproteobacteria bacterium]